jgi:hypothetical protein
MPHLARRRNRYAREDLCLIYYGDVRIETGAFLLALSEIGIFLCAFIYLVERGEL